MKRVLFAILLLCLHALPSFAIEPERREVIVVSTRAWDGYQYKETFLPSTYPELTLIAGQDSAVAFVRTEEYFWPLSRQVYVDLDKQRDVIDGTLRIEKGGAVLSEEKAQPYAILYPDGAINGNGSLLWGEEAIAAYAADQQAQRDFARTYVEAQRANTDYERRLLESGAARAQGKPVEVIPPPPPLPTPSLRLVTKPLEGFRIGLDPGLYKISVRRDGAMVPGTERSLRVVSITGRDEIVTDVVPEERWTQPLASNSARSRIFAKPGSTVYLSLLNAQKYDEADYLPVVSPQSQPLKGRDMWVRRKPSTLSTISVDGSAQAQQALKVEQTSGSSFGYVVRPASQGETPDMTAFAVDVPADPARSRMMVSDQGSGFWREIVVVHPRRAVLGLALALLPFAIAILLVIRRRWKAKAA